MSQNFLTDNFMDFIMRKHFDFDEIQQDFSDRWTEDEFNCYIAEQALDIAFDLYPDDQVGEDNDTLMDKRHEFVSTFMEFARSEVTRQWASNLGMVPLANYESKEVTNERVKIHGQRKYNDGYDDGVNNTIKDFSKMSSYEFSKWKLKHIELEQKINASKILADKTDDHVVQDSEDEAWEQMMAIRERKFDV